MAEYCKICGLMLITDKERTLRLCRFCMTDYERKYAELIVYNRRAALRLWSYGGALMLAGIALVIRLLR